MNQEVADIKKLELDLRRNAKEETIKEDLATLVDDIFGAGVYVIVKMDGAK